MKFRRLLSKKAKSNPNSEQKNLDEQVIKLKGKFKEKSVKPELNISLLDLAVKNNIDWQFACTNGNCARCRCYVQDGAELLSDVNSAENSRLDLQEINDGYRLGCQAMIVRIGPITAVNKSYY
ncbi:2Fe-2S iron-sulfur cluster-binding protein [Chengkuizengella sediminis]|uniref:2Fe-2S iron-sulfur cluster-binding protein n=1 Tax=Chengkuizengella sediminis TaxID=1885917 RepID=UPI00138A43B2|nr:2Fe-2S iron-sulfur cluster-binding protein [Chengkuizengella sediminis]NDI34341.1 (2Fe-2S)-binding protein [Chengkuizengella sediminis]